MTWAAVCAGAFLVAMLLATIESTRDEGTARDTVFRALGDELWLWLLVFGPLAMVGIAVGRWLARRLTRARGAVDVAGPPIGLVLMTVLVILAIRVLSRL
ncbi:uncharacterized membrane protein YsdA (DUF1294 family) [Nocardioides massiliensis]|uniref:Uncharacterized membrane protein YsdA (DUF1294 family) n=1 Tax=Nocardioides massiliensis TaxID=1325935 RepID=A0ABT9NU29_9ACTN|nr:hypothetical protein [Nocardioides massiliensis]MDP9823908.1 uncharacterized membrane protein YsdA (DUF1294 family) [Nocardioides massiliensis]